MITNPCRPTTVNLQQFLLPVVISIDSDEGNVTAERVMASIGREANYQLERALPDSLDRVPSQPMPFAFHGAKPCWTLFSEILSGNEGFLVAARLTAREVDVLKLGLAFMRIGACGEGVQALRDKYALPTKEEVDEVIRKLEVTI